jgi:hypothetical protein
MAPIVGGVATRNDSGCSYGGRTAFDLNSEVTFIFVNDTQEWNKGFSVFKVPEGITVEEIDEMQRAFNLPDFEEEDRRYSPYLPTGQGRGPGSVSELSVLLNRPGLHALICFELFDDDDLGQDYAASLFTVNEWPWTFNAHNRLGVSHVDNPPWRLWPLIVALLLVTACTSRAEQGADTTSDSTNTSMQRGDTTSVSADRTHPEDDRCHGECSISRSRKCRWHRNP